MLTAITGVNWGDEGKGRMVDLLSEQYGVMARVWAVSAKTIRVLSRFSPTKTILGLSIITF